MATAQERRIAVRDRYRRYIGRNHYSQARRDYCTRPYTDGRYYSDCSSSISYAYREAGEGFGILNTVGMWTSAKMQDVPVTIKNGVIQNPEALRVGDMLLFAGNDKGRKAWGYVGHVEMLGEISGATYTLYGHGSGLAKRHELHAYCKSRYKTKSVTPLGHRGLIRVRRAIQDDGTGGGTGAGERILRKGSTGDDVRAMQSALIRLGYDCGSWGADGDFGDATDRALRAFQRDKSLTVDGEYGPKSRTALAAALETATERTVVITGAAVYVRRGPGKQYAPLGIVHRGDRLDYQGERTADGWLLVAYKPEGATVPTNGWVSGLYGEVMA